ncbi:MAG: sulfatase-like hydrolase/transferase [Bacteroidetes bacterium]|nr:sulfatase-like hydrolase/transferase [Bacteroidota bacterium]
MKGTHFLPILFTLILVSCTTGERKTDLSKPNIILIMADDLGYGDLGCFGAEDIKTPNIDRIATEGIRFTDYYSASSVCSPSRAALLTGRLPQRMGINGVFSTGSFTGMPSPEVTIAEVLKAKGYTTGIVGKWHLGHQYEFLPLQQGFDEYFGIPYSNDMASVVYMRGNYVEEIEVDQQYITKRYTEEALDFIDRHHNDPFFLYIPHSMPHVPIYTSGDFIGTSERGLYGDVVQEIDWSVGEVLKKVEEYGLTENTLIVFTSDNGPWLAMKEFGGSAGILRGGKFFTFEGGMRVPAVAMWKGIIPSGQVTSDMVSMMDWMPTIMDVTGGKPAIDRVIDGKNIMDLLSCTGKRASNTYLYIYLDELRGYQENGWKVKLPFEGFVGARWKVAVAPHDTLLFNLKTDPGEKTDLFSENPGKAWELCCRMDSAYKSLGDLPPSLIMNSPADKSHFERMKQ